MVSCRKVAITVLNAREVITKMKKVRKGDGGVGNIWSLKEKISGTHLSIQTSRL